MIDEGELDWKVIGVSTADPKVVKYIYGPSSRVHIWLGFRV
jgi:hypothetical protein